MLRCLTVATLVLLCADVHAQQRVRLPLEGYCRPGKCMPVQIEPAGSITLSGDGIVPTHVGAARTGIVPVLVLGGGELLGEALRPLSPAQKLVGNSTSDPSIAATLFPGDEIVQVSLDPVSLMPGSVLAWEALDAVVLSRVPPGITDLLVNGTTIAVRSPSRPDDGWPWQRVGECWVLRPERVGPATALAGEVAYLPAASWQAPAPASFRRNIVLVGVLVTIILLATLLVGRRWILWTALAAVACSAGIEAWRRSLPAFRSASGSIVVAGPLVQRDYWQYFRGSSDSIGSVALEGTIRPRLIDPRHAAAVELALICPDDSSDYWQFRLRRGQTMAFVEPQLAPEARVPQWRPTTRSHLYELARQGYLREGLRIVGETSVSTDAADRWPDVVIERSGR